MKKTIALLWALSAILLVSCEDDIGMITTVQPPKTDAISTADSISTEPAATNPGVDSNTKQAYEFELTESGDSYRMIGIKKGYKVQKTLTVPSEYEGLPVVEIVSLGAYPVSGSYHFGTVEIPGSVKRIGDNVFAGRITLKFLHLSEGLEEIGNGAFCYTEIVNLELPESLITIGAQAFENCDISTIRIPGGVVKIGEMCFSSCSRLSEITVAEGNRYYHSAGNCLIETESKTLLAGCQTSEIPDDGSVTKIARGAFAGAEFTSLTIPDAVTQIEERAFADCIKLETITLPKNITEIGNYLFAWCEKMQEITIPSGVTRIGESVFEECKSLSDVYFEGTEEQWKAITIASGNDALTSANIHFGSAG